MIVVEMAKIRGQLLGHSKCTYVHKLAGRNWLADA